MATEDLVTEQFQFLGLDIQGDILKKCVSICEEYNVEPEDFVEQWMAFSLSNLNGAPPNLDSLNLLERKEFCKRLPDRNRDLPRDTKLKAAGVPLTIYCGTSEEKPDTEVISNYVTTTPKRPNTEHSVTHTNELGPATYCPSVTHSAKYSSRSNAGALLLSHGSESILQDIDIPNIHNITDIKISQVPNDDGDTYTQAMFGFELLNEKSSVYDNHVSYLSQCIMKKYGITQLSSVKSKAQMEVHVTGRIECDADARLNPKCAVIQGTWQDSLSQAIPLDLDQLQQYALFTGQVVVMRGINPRGDKFIAHEVYSDASLPLADHKLDLINTFKGSMSIVISSGPYTTSDNLAYEPLKDLIKYICSHRPHVVIMTGPFLDSDHTKLNDNTLAETFKSLFDKLLENIAEIIATSPYTKVVIVSSLKDAFHLNIYPTPAYSSRRKHSNILFVPDPCTLNINGIHVGVTSTDILMHLSQEEISVGAGGDKLARLAGHVLKQQSYYPLWPPPTNHPVDAALWSAHAHLTSTPHLLITPSNFRYFVKEVHGSLVINPEHLTKGTGGGMFAKVQLKIDDKTQKVADGTAVQIIRI